MNSKVTGEGAADEAVKKSIAIFAYQERILSIEMKTKLVQHVESESMRDSKSVRVRKSEIVRESENESK